MHTQGSESYSTKFTSNTSYKRRDADFALNYRLNDYFKLFIGAKYMAYKAEFLGKMRVIGSAGGDIVDYTGNKEPRACGPGLGLNCTLPVIDNLFILGTLSGFYLWGKEKGRLEIIYSEYNATNLVGKFCNDKFNYKEYGINSNLSIAYYITNISTAISLGGRLQYFKTDCGNIKDLLTSTANLAYGGYGYGIHNGNKIQKIYGITLTATYSFSI